MKPVRQPIPDQGETSGDPGRIECPTCGRPNDLTGDPILDEGDEFDCDHCDAKCVVIGVDYDITITVKAKKHEPA